MKFTPIWKINESFYENFNLPNGMISQAYGLLITQVSVHLNGTIFQCLVVNGMSKSILKSSIGRLIVDTAPEGRASNVKVLVH